MGWWRPPLSVVPLGLEASAAACGDGSNSVGTLWSERWQLLVRGAIVVASSLVWLLLHMTWEP